jgi:hypothetical protein
MEWKYPKESLIDDEARLRHPDHEIQVARIFDENGERREVVFVWEDIGPDEKAAVAIYWLAPTKLH